jgi:hypothetical protein
MSEADYSPTTMYLRGGDSHPLFARPQKTSAFGTGVPYLFLGEADYLEHRGERPIAITWRLRSAMPAADFVTASVVG